MKHTKLALTLFSLIALSGFNNNEDKLVSEIEKYKIKMPSSLIQSSKGFYPGIGSGIEFSKKLQDGKLEFYAISDRGPNFPYENNDNKIISFYPQYTPKIVKIIVDSKSNSAQVQEFINLKYNNKLISGINPNQNPSDEIILDVNLKQIKTDFGLDSESISILKNGDFVVGDEYFPSINIVNHKTGEIIKRLTPGNGLPEILKHRNFNRGFESLTVTPNGKIYAILEGVLNIDAESNKNAKLLRLIEIDLENSSTKTYAYPFDYNQYKDSSKVKIGDLASIDNDTLILVEQGSAIDDKYRNLIYKINLKNAVDISNIKLENQKELEYLTLEELLSNITFLKKELLINPREYGWEEKKLEGLTVIDKKTIAITNDNDFGISGYKIEENNCNQKKSNNCNY